LQAAKIVEFCVINNQRLCRLCDMKKRRQVYYEISSSLCREKSSTFES
jgi:hypothetical protein